MSSFKKNTIQKSFLATGIWPPNLTPILKRFSRNTPKVLSSDKSLTLVLSGLDWLKIKSLIRKVLKDKSSKEVKKLNRSLYHISAQNEILRHKIKGLKNALVTKEKQKKKSHPLDLQNSQDNYHRGAVFWSLRKLRQAKERKT